MGNNQSIYGPIGISSNDYSQPLIDHGSESSNLDLDRKHNATMEAKVGKDVPATNFKLVPDNLEDVPPEVYNAYSLRDQAVECYATYLAKLGIAFRLRYMMKTVQHCYTSVGFLSSFKGEKRE
ncbi:hypothetical protein JHK87_018698 [Glycine soja]|nr:hypothetical protein JHK87_018698 [Glycine soja]